MARLVVGASSAGLAAAAAERAVSLVGEGHRVTVLCVTNPALVTSPISDSEAGTTARLAPELGAGPEEVVASAARVEADARSELDDALRLRRLDTRVRVPSTPGSSERPCAALRRGASGPHRSRPPAIGTGAAPPAGDRGQRPAPCSSSPRKAEPPETIGATSRQPLAGDALDHPLRETAPPIGALDTEVPFDWARRGLAETPSSALGSRRIRPTGVAAGHTTREGRRR